MPGSSYAVDSRMRLMGYIVAASMTSIERTKVAAQASCDPRTVRRYVDNKKVLPVYRIAIEKALKELGLDSYVQKDKAAQ